MNEELAKNLMTAMGAIVEVSSNVFKMYMEQGMDKETALELTKTMLGRLMESK